MKSQAVTLLALLIDVEAELRRLALWNAEAPTLEALASTQPFAVDTLSFPEWLQWIFIVRLRALAEAGHALPQVSGVAPMADQYFAGLGLDASAVVTHLDAIDVLLSGKSAR